MHSARSDEQKWSGLAAAAQRGDKRAYNELLTDLSSYVRNVLMRDISDAGAVEDVVQEVLISVHKSLKTYSPDLRFKPWLFSIIRFRKADYLRKYYGARKDKAVPLEQADFAAQNVTNPVHAGELKDIEEALNTLPKRQRKIFTRIKLEGYSAQDVADEMGMNISAVKVSAHRAMKKLQGILKSEQR